MKSIYKLIWLLFLLPASLFAQQELLLQQSPELWHSNSLNPAFFPEGRRIAIGLPAFGLDAAHSGDISYNDFFREDGDKTYLDFGQAIDRLEPQNKLFFDQRTETVSFGFRFPGGLMLQAGHAIRLTGILDYPKTLPELIWNGNAAYIGQEVNIGPVVHISDWNEWSVGLGHTFGPLQLGVRAKYLSGISSLQGDDSRRKIGIYTDADYYQLTLNTDYAFHSASIISGIDTAGLGYDLNVYDLKNTLFSENTGFALDFGAQLNLGNRLSVSASVLDVGGKINWKEKSYFYESKGSYEYTGTEVPGADIIKGIDSIDFSNKLDTLNDIFKFNRTTTEFSTKLPLRVYLSGSFKLTDRFRLGLSMFHQSSEARSTNALGVSAHWGLLKWVTLGGLVSIHERFADVGNLVKLGDTTAADFGFQLSLTPGPVQFYVMSDNILNAFSIKSRAAVNLRLGLSLVF